MLGLMQDWPLLCHRILDHAARHHGAREVVTRSVEGPVHRTNYGEIRARALKVAQLLERYGIREGQRVATLAWTTWRHMEVWYGAAGIGAVYHTVNPRLFPDQITYIVNHAEDRLVFADVTFVALLEQLQDKLPCVEGFIILTDRAHMPQTSLRNAQAYEDWLAQADGDFEWAALDERAAAGMCYTSGTTGNPKGVVYTHRSNVLHAMAVNVPDMVGLSSRDRVLPAVPMFHANGWSIPFSAPLAGAALVLPGMKMDGESIYDLLENERVTFTDGVPTVWQMLLAHMGQSGKRLSHLERIAIGGAALPPAMARTFQIDYGIDVMQAWGMTEMSPIGALCTAKPETAALDGEERVALQEKAGIAPFTVEMKITGDDGREMPWDGTSRGNLKVRGPAVSSAYFKGAGGDILDPDGFFDTGDVATIDANGYMQISDRSKDIIKSGGEWISSIDIENLAMAHPGIREAAVIGIAHPKWDERPLLVVVPKPDRSPTAEQILDFMSGKVAKWWLPERYAFIAEVPKTSVGKFDKKVLRAQYADGKLTVITRE